jgi:hypothetical protein
MTSLKASRRDQAVASTIMSSTGPLTGCNHRSPARHPGCVVVDTASQMKRRIQEEQGHLVTCIDRSREIAHGAAQIDTVGDRGGISHHGAVEDEVADRQNQLCPSQTQLAAHDAMGMIGKLTEGSMQLPQTDSAAASRGSILARAVGSTTTRATPACVALGPRPVGSWTRTQAIDPDAGVGPSPTRPCPVVPTF